MKTRQSGMPPEIMWAEFFSPEETFKKLGLSPDCGDVVDFGCGFGTFAVPAARVVGGIVHALDVDPEMTAATEAKARGAGIQNVRVHLRDFTLEGSGLDDGSVGYAMLFNILHCEDPLGLLREAWRVLSPGGTLAVMHWNYDPSTPRGPSMDIRPSPQQCRAWAIQTGFTPRDQVDLPPHHFGMTFTKGPAVPEHPPLLDHPIGRPSAFRPEDLVNAVRRQRGIDAQAIPEVCVLDFDGDLTDALVAEGRATACPEWPCFHTSMWMLEFDGRRCGLVARTIGGPYAVLVAEQLAACGARAIVGLASAGRIDPALPVPAVIVADEAVRDEGTSFHYLPAGWSTRGTLGLAEALEAEARTVGLPARRGLVWTTDAPYRETFEQIESYKAKGVLAVEMQAASLFAFAAARGVDVGVIAHVTNGFDHEGESFDKGTHDLQFELLRAACRGAFRHLGRGYCGDTEG